MIRRRLIPLALAVTVLLAVVAIVARGRPLGSGKGSGRGLPISFWDFAFTTLAIVEVVLFIVGVAAIIVFRREGLFIDKIFRGAKPGDLPIEQPTKFELVVNLKTAKVLGLEMAPALLARADEVIE